jgi:hypothetical protein
MNNSKDKLAEARKKLEAITGVKVSNKKINGCIISTKEVGDTFYFKAEWDNNDKEAACKEILEILEMKVGPRSPKNEIYYKVNEFCNQFDLNSSFDFLASKIRKEFAGTPNLEEIIYTVLD